MELRVVSVDSIGGQMGQIQIGVYVTRTENICLIFLAILTPFFLQP
jgi:hypothetical protein